MSSVKDIHEIEREFYSEIIVTYIFIILIVIVYRCDIFWDDATYFLKRELSSGPLGNPVDILRGLVGS